jgi:DNA primase
VLPSFSVFSFDVRGVFVYTALSNRVKVLSGFSMPLYAKDSLEALRQKVDLVDVVSFYVKMTKSGASYKGLCPFHDEKTPSFLIHKGDSHYHCFGCGAHGDAIAFLMGHAKMTFVESLEFLSERFQVPLEKVQQQEKGPNKTRLKQILERANLWYRFFLLHSEEAEPALRYLYDRGLDLAFIHKFELGYAPKQGDILLTLLKQDGFWEEELKQVGLIRSSNTGKNLDFFNSRITFPIKDRIGNIIGFSARKFQEETFGGKYINTAETVLFKKSQILFGLSYSRKRIAREKKALIVEGQIDALRLIHEGFDFAIAGQGTAFGEGHVKELLQLGIRQVYLALDGDKAGQEAAIKIGNFFQGKGVEVLCLTFPSGMDPDAFLRSQGKNAFETLLEEAKDYLSFYYEHLCKDQDLASPSKKSEIVETIASKVRVWEQPIMIHESLKKLARLAGIPEETMAIETRSPFVKRQTLMLPTVNPDRVLEQDLLRWMLFSADKIERVLKIIRTNLSSDQLKIPECQKLFEIFLGLAAEERTNWLSIAGYIEKPEEQQILDEVWQRKVNPLKAEEGVIVTIRQILLRNWMEKKEQITLKIQNETEEEVIRFSLQQIDELNKSPPEVLIEL